MPTGAANVSLMVNSIDGHRGGSGHAAGEAAHEVERLQLRLVQAVVGRLLGPRGDGRQLPRVLVLGRLA